MARTDTMNNAPMTAFLMGSLLGVAAGLLFAPKSGRESREMIRQTARENVDKMREKARQKRHEAASSIQQGADKIQDVVELKEDATPGTAPGLDKPRSGRHTAL
jgi:gas vesicle protein